MRRAFIGRWYVTLFGLIVTAALCAGAAVLISPQYQAKAIVLLIPPGDAATKNPYLNLGSVSGVTDVLHTALTSQSTLVAIKKRNLSGSYTIANGLTTSSSADGSPLVVITATGKTPAVAKATATFITSLIPSNLKELQSSAGVSDSASYITSQVLNPVGTTTSVRKNQIRGLIAAVVVGLLFTIFLVAGVENLATRRARSRQTRGDRRRRPSPGSGEDDPDGTSGRASDDGTDTTLEDSLLGRSGSAEPVLSRTETRAESRAETRADAANGRDGQRFTASNARVRSRAAGLRRR